MKVYFVIFVFFSLGISTCFCQNSEIEASMQRGSEIYSDFCASCHLEQGEGITYTFPPLAQSDYLMENREASIRGVKYGQQGEITVNGVTYNNIMAPLGLDDQEVADVMNYIMNSWGNSSEEMVTLKEVENIQK